MFSIVIMMISSISNAEPMATSKGFNINLEPTTVQSKATKDGFTCMSAESKCTKNMDDGSIKEIIWQKSDNSNSLDFLYFNCVTIGACGASYNEVGYFFQQEYNIEFDTSQQLQPDRNVFENLNLLCAQGKENDLLCMSVDENLGVSGVIYDRYKMVNLSKNSSGDKSTPLEERDTSSWETFIEFNYNGSKESLGTEIGVQIYENFSDKIWLRNTTHQCVQLITFDKCPEYKDIVNAENDAVEEYLQVSGPKNVETSSVSEQISKTEQKTTPLEERDTSSWETFIEFNYNGSKESLGTEIGVQIYENFSDKIWLRNTTHQCVQLITFDKCPEYKDIVKAENAAVKEYLKVSGSKKHKSKTASKGRDASTWETFIEFEYNGSNETLGTVIGSEIYEEFSKKSWLKNAANGCVQKRKTRAYCNHLEDVVKLEKEAVEEYLLSPNYAGETDVRGSVEQRLAAIKYENFSMQEQQIIQSGGFMVALVNQCIDKTNLTSSNEDALKIDEHLKSYSDIYEFMGLSGVINGEVLFENSRYEDFTWISNILKQGPNLSDGSGMQFFDNECKKFISEVAKIFNSETENVRKAFKKSKYRALDSYDKPFVLPIGSNDLIYNFTNNMENAIFLIEKEQERILHASIIPNELKLIKSIQDESSLSQSISSLQGKRLKINSTWDKEIPLISTEKKLEAYTDATFETKVKNRFKIGSDSQYEAMNLIFDASNILRRNGKYASRSEKDAVENWTKNFSQYFNFEKQILLPEGYLRSNPNSKPEPSSPFYVNFNEALYNKKYTKLFKGKFELGSVTMRDIRIHVADFRCVITDIACVIPHNNDAGLMTSTSIVPYPLVERNEFWEKLKSLDVFPGDVVSMDIVIRGYIETVVGGASQIFVHPLTMKLLEKEKFKFVDGKFK
jgi:Fe-S cluster biosynthesis and repair protein YggX